MANNKFCIECGFELPRTAKFCEECGVKLTVSDTEVPETVVEIEEERVDEEKIDERPSYLKKRERAPQKPSEPRTMHDVAKEISESNAKKIEKEESDEEKIIADELGIDFENTQNTIKGSRENNTCPNCFEKLSREKINELKNSNAEYVYCEKCDVIFDKFQKEVRKELEKKDFYAKPKKTPTVWGPTRWILTIMVISFMWLWICSS